MERRANANGTRVCRHPETDQRQLDLLEWGLLRWWQKGTERPHPPDQRARRVRCEGRRFRGAFAKCRAIVPADALYEWKGKRPYAIARQDADVMAFAGQWEGFRRSNGHHIGDHPVSTAA